MDFFDKCILSVLRDGRSRDFNHLLREVEFSHNTLRLHLRRLVEQGFVVEEKTRLKGVEDPDTPILCLQRFVVKPIDSSQTLSARSSPSPSIS